jgi:CRISPR-associated protein Cas1
MAEAALSEAGLGLNKAKTSIKPVTDGFEFLGMRFGDDAADEDPEEAYRRQKKPLYVTEPYTFLSLNGDALDIKRGGEVVETLPIRRLSEIMVMEKASLSTALLRKCADSNVPLTITLNSGYYITTVKPDSKKYYDVSFEHGRKYASLSETEILMFAKEFAAGKLTGYASLFRQRQAGEAYRFAGELDRVVKDIHAAGDVHQVRGFEGAAAKKTYVKLNGLIDNPAFHIKKRDRRNPDRVNSLLNFGYYLLFSRVNATVRALGLNPYLGFLHSPADNYESLVCDIEELFRARIDRLVVRLVNLKVIAEADFTETGKGLYLTRAAAKKYLYQFEAEMDRKKGKAVLSMKDEIYVQAAILKKWALENGSLSFYNWRA